MKQPDYIPQDYSRIQVVQDFDALFNTRFGPVNCVIWPRSQDPLYREQSLTADFNGLAQNLEAVFPFPRHIDINHIAIGELAHVKGLPERQETARRLILADLEAVSRWLRDPSGASLRIAAPQKKAGGFHHDMFPGKDGTGRILCSYNDPATEWLQNEDSRSRKYSRHVPVPGAPVYHFQAGDIWRQAKGMPVSGNPLVRAFMNAVFHRKVPPFIHRTPAAAADSAPRLLLVAE